MKRKAILAAGAAALLPGLVLGASAPPPAARARAFVAPPGPLILTRTVQRGLPDGKEIVSTRRYELRIVPDGKGFRVDGHLLDVTLDAPPSLAALADIERRRKDDGLFPFYLDARGFIASRATARDETATQRADQSARRSIDIGPMPEPDRRLSETFVGRLLAREGGAGGQWPVDLFRPVPGRRSETRAVPGGSALTTIETRQGTPTSPGDVIERTVTTEADGTRRISRETYRVEPAGRE